MQIISYAEKINQVSEIISFQNNFDRKAFFNDYIGCIVQIPTYTDCFKKISWLFAHLKFLQIVIKRMEYSTRFEQLL